MNCEQNMKLIPNGIKSSWARIFSIPVFVFLIATFFGCQPSGGQSNLALLAALNQSGSASIDPGEAYSGGYTTVFAYTDSTAFDIMAVNLLRDGGPTKFNAGNSFFNRDWVAEGNSASAGLGPTFNTNSCQNCHLRDGRGAPPSAGGSLDSIPGILFRLSKAGQTDPTTGGPVGLDDYGLQLNHKAIPGVTAEGSVSLSYSGPTIVRTYSDPPGATVTLTKPVYTFTWNFSTPAAGTYNVSPRTAQIIPGLGLLEAIPEETILAWADPDDSKDGDGITGKINMVWDAKTQTKVLGRFGWKANEPSLFQQVQGAFLGDIGITSPLFSTDNCPAVQTDCITASGGTPEPEITAKTADSVVFYNSMVGIPARRNLSDQDVIDGKTLFSSVGCAACHKPYVQTGYKADFPELSFQHIKPYTDLLLHDMGPDLADGRPDFDADGQEWRTAPLWGSGMIYRVNGHRRLLHDGRANGFEEAILWHGGEADNARIAFQALTQAERAKLIKFLDSL
ncbi:di-heme oxidoredictase family protein [Leptospira wolffii]|uniref:Di-heme oxidoredictase family protein n=1 Tax=Leptospira wolffii TaxID=409998 RepID=A0ABV5BUW5_9LEPT